MSSSHITEQTSTNLNAPHIEKQLLNMNSLQHIKSKIDLLLDFTESPLKTRNLLKPSQNTKDKNKIKEPQPEKEEEWMIVT